MQPLENLQYHRQLPNSSLSPFIKFFWSLKNDCPDSKPVTILPDGYFDMLFTSVNGKPYTCSIIGLATRPTTFIIKPFAKTFAISFKLLAAEKFLSINISELIDNRKKLPENLWNIDWSRIHHLNDFADSISAILTPTISDIADRRKQILFEEIYPADGNITVRSLSELTGWNAREINRYFRRNFGLPLKLYCNILRFRESFEQLHKGELSPSLNYYDQAHFIREVRRFAGTSPKHLAINSDDRFIQFSTL